MSVAVERTERLKDRIPDVLAAELRSILGRHLERSEVQRLPFRNAVQRAVEFWCKWQPRRLLGIDEDDFSKSVTGRAGRELAAAGVLSLELRGQGDGRIMWAKRVPQSLLGKVKGGMGVHIISFEKGEDLYRKLCESLRY